jgi:transposase
MAKYSQEFKLEVVHYYLNECAGYKRTAHRYGINHDAVRKWVNIYKQHGETGLARQTGKTLFTVDFKQEVVSAMLNEGLSSREAAQRFKIKERWMLVRWLRLYQADGIEGLHPKPRGRPKGMSKPHTSKTSSADGNKTQAELLEELAYLRAENAFLKKLKALRLEQEAEQQRLQDLYQD